MPLANARKPAWLRQSGWRHSFAELRGVSPRIGRWSTGSDVARGVPGPAARWVGLGELGYPPSVEVTERRRLRISA